MTKLFTLLLTCLFSVSAWANGVNLPGMIVVNTIDETPTKLKSYIQRSLDHRGNFNLGNLTKVTRDKAPTANLGASDQYYVVFINNESQPGLSIQMVYPNGEIWVEHYDPTRAAERLYYLPKL